MSSATEGVTTAAAQAKRARIVELVIAGASVNEAAEKVGVSRRHAYRLISDPESRAEIAKAARESAKSAQLVLQRGAEEAARSLVAMSTGKTKATPAKVAAARGVLEFAVEKAASNLNVTASRTIDPTAFAGAARAALEAAVLAAEAGVTDGETVGLPADPVSLPVVAGEGAPSSPTAAPRRTGGES